MSITCQVPATCVKSKEVKKQLTVGINQMMNRFETYFDASYTYYTINAYYTIQTDEF